MKRLSIYLIIGISLLLTSCHLVTSDNGDLDGLWQMTIMEDLQTGEVSDGRDNSVSWAFQGGMVQMNGNTIPLNHVIGKFEKGGNSLRIYHMAIFTHSKGDTPIEDASMLEVVGITQLDENFQILELNSNTLRLESAAKRLTFRKY